MWFIRTLSVGFITIHHKEPTGLKIDKSLICSVTKKLVEIWNNPINSSLNLNRITSYTNNKFLLRISLMHARILSLIFKFLSVWRKKTQLKLLRACGTGGHWWHVLLKINKDRKSIIIEPPQIFRPSAVPGGCDVIHKNKPYFFFLNDTNTTPAGEPTCISNVSWTGRVVEWVRLPLLEDLAWSKTRVCHKRFSETRTKWIRFIE